MSAPSSKMAISSAWLQVAILTFATGFLVLGYLAYVIHTEHPPIPERVNNPDGAVLFTGKDVMAGQHIFQKYGLMQFGTIFGHGAYLGPDFTAQYLHHAAQEMLSFYGEGQASGPEIRARVEAELKTNRHDSGTDTLTYTAGQAYAFERMVGFYQGWFGPSDQQVGLLRPHLADAAEVRRLTAYFSWAAWVAAATRPGTDYSYTNNWPEEPLVGNRPTAQAFLASVLSLIALLGGIGLVMFAVGRYNLLGWHRLDEEDPEARLTFRPPEEVRLTPAQRATAWYFLVVAGLFLLQGLLGGANAHYHVEPEGFYGVRISNWLPYNLSRMWHVQLALFFVSASFLAMGIFIAPMIAGREPKHQEKLAIALFGAVVLVVVGSLLGEAASLKDYISRSGPWFWIGSQGWEYLDLGRLWQVLLTLGMLIWVVILFRSIRNRLAGEHPGNLPYLFLYSALSIPLFYAAGMVFGKQANFAVVDFWRFWVVHLWVEDFLELFTTIMVAYIFVLLGVVRTSTATRVVYLDVILYSIGGVIGTMHHLYFSGAPAVHMALGAFFSAMEVIPLVLLTYEAWHFMRLGGQEKERSVLGASSAAFPHKWAVMFLVAVGFWNFLGAGVFGFLINLPIVSYYEIGTQFTANHGHGAMMGVYGMLAIGFFMFVARYFIPPDTRSEKAMKYSFWSLNIGLAWMLFANLVPIGIVQLYDSFQNGYWHARELAFFQQPWIRVIEWLRMPGDLLFILGGILPVVYLALRMFANRNRYGQLPAEMDTEELVYEPGTSPKP
ncbi:MAG: cbb3-type cytochrome c oxidase subunit I [Candidatus Tectomicrobia bacterium]|uniref:Cbb3-type cytochrome c oxidase subunit I n=1 Tax=Tectimicrobiota bacterium TaxID=2528274 RepID=A0A932CPP1_UNCTE|nr:cbb3-type cytochrome c oxidase subunit I [Candidatus Tectomicrobia bacterium]